VQPAAGDSGGALGAALTIYHLYADRPRTANTADGMVGSYLGPEFNDGETQTRLTAAGARYATLPRDRLLARTARRSPTASPWAGSRGEWSLVRARSAIARSSPILAIRTCRRSSI
jgi:predicted NodU family carbamoyl transferase